MIIKSVKVDIDKKFKSIAERVNLPEKIKKIDEYYDEMMAEGLKLKLKK